MKQIRVGVKNSCNPNTKNNKENTYYNDQMLIRQQSLSKHENRKVLPNI